MLQWSMEKEFDALFGQVVDSIGDTFQPSTNNNIHNSTHACACTDPQLHAKNGWMKATTCVHRAIMQ